MKDFETWQALYLYEVGFPPSGDGTDYPSSGDQREFSDALEDYFDGDAYGHIFDDSVRIEGNLPYSGVLQTELEFPLSEREWKDAKESFLGSLEEAAEESHRHPEWNNRD